MLDPLELPKTLTEYHHALQRARRAAFCEGAQWRRVVAIPDYVAEQDMADAEARKRFAIVRRAPRVVKLPDDALTLEGRPGGLVQVRSSAGDTVWLNESSIRAVLDVARNPTEEIEE